MEEDKPTSKSNLIQTKLTNLDSSTPGVSQKLADKVIMNFIIDTVQPLSLVDNDSFIKMINTFSPRTKIFCRQTLMARILESFKEMKESLILNLSDVSYVCTTADCWTHNRRAYLGITAHWIDPKNLKQKSVALALKRIIGCQTYDILANIIAEIHRSYKIQNKVMQYVAASLKILEVQDNMRMGYYVPTLSILITKLKRINNLKFCQPLVESMLKGIEKRFPDLYDDDNVIAAIVHPSFKLGHTLI
ncbi:uncharacterized protein LOC135925831 [Gordionus sp. m RMFG-2023]|uniref:uncharacterized protein LOC135925831 n=1 Tax=Gordionus sp. m RMFG-2023 TaxID=3053472 RepID=UPI0031FD2494